MLRFVCTGSVEDFVATKREFLAFLLCHLWHHQEPVYVPDARDDKVKIWKKLCRLPHILGANWHRVSKFKLDNIWPHCSQKQTVENWKNAIFYFPMGVIWKREASDFFNSNKFLPIPFSSIASCSTSLRSFGRGAIGGKKSGCLKHFTSWWPCKKNFLFSWSLGVLWHWDVF